jgi:hypothetical protein
MAAASGKMIRARKETSVQENTRTEEEQESFLAHDRIAQRAYCLWIDRGCPPDSADMDWRDARQQLEGERSSAEGLAE